MQMGVYLTSQLEADIYWKMSTFGIIRTASTLKPKIINYYAQTH